jgi:hypothetical protein
MHTHPCVFHALRVHDAFNCLEAADTPDVYVSRFALNWRQEVLLSAPGSACRITYFYFVGELKYVGT